MYSFSTKGNLILFIILNFICIYVYKSWNNSDVICIKNPNISYTHIVGAGTAGCVIAARLSENKRNKVLLIEAGAHFNVYSKVPLFATFLQRSKHDWLYESESQKWSSNGFYQNKQFLPRGKGLGGTGQMNFMIHGNDENNCVIRYCDYKQYLFFNISAEKMRKIKCKVKTDYLWYLQKQSSYLDNALQESVLELNDHKLEYSPCLSTIHNGKRWTTYDSHLVPASNRLNLHIMCNTEVTKILFTNKRAIAIHAIDGSKNKHIVFSKTGIVLCTGTINTPKLLLLSGIGNTTELKKLNISAIHHAPGVGLNMYDHFNVPLYISLSLPVSITLSKILQPRELYNYIFYGKGLFASSSIVGFINSSANLNIILFGMGSTNENILCHIANYIPKTFRSMFPFYSDYNQEGCVFLATCTQPKSRGFVKLRDNKYTSTPVIDPHYLQEPYDVNCISNALHLIVKIVNTTKFKKAGAKIHWPQFETCINYEQDFNNDDYMECIIRTAGSTQHHQGGTCRMGDNNDPHSVVDQNFRVKGVTGLHIVDASILPNPVSTFPNSILVALAERAVEEF